MTTIAFRNGIIAADSRATINSEAGGTRIVRCRKLFRKIITNRGRKQEVIIATAGETFPSLIFVDWFGSGKDPPEKLLDGEADFSCLVLSSDGLFEFDKWCRGEEVLDKFYAVGSGTKAALGAMHMGASAKRAVEIACRIDPYSAPPIATMRLKK